MHIEESRADLQDGGDEEKKLDRSQENIVEDRAS